LGPTMAMRRATRPARSANWSLDESDHNEARSTMDCRSNLRRHIKRSASQKRRRISMVWMQAMTALQTHTAIITRRVVLLGNWGGNHVASATQSAHLTIPKFSA
ncbi:hypothetical protein, partial [Ralstonia pseudosolanacearum]|uniref:hypothetical protein n=1 Tax=Ralstonia pseudosolanacearum TaxID=1310165 RepID=UPI003CF0691F